MCIFCAAIPAAAALGAAAQGKRAEARRRAAAEPRVETTVEPTRPAVSPDRLPIAAITGVVIAGLIVGSVVTHITTSG